MALVLFERNGQGYFDFSELLVISTVEFVERVQTCIELYTRYDVEFRVKVELNKYAPAVYLVQENRVRMFRCYEGSSVVHEMVFTKEDVERLGGVFE